MRYPEQREQVVRYGIEMESTGLTVGTAGNVSVLVEDGIIISPSSMAYRETRPEDTILMDLAGNVLEGERMPSVEHKVHLAMYKARSDVKAVIHAHPTVATAFAAARIEIPGFLDEFGVYVGDAVRVAEYAISGTDEIADNVARAMGETSHAALIASHGMVCVGKDLASAFHVCQQVERTALIYVYAKMLGGPVELPQSSKDLFAQVFAYKRTV
ncbi:MAG: class II aldolase/adducin family protein [Actinomycetota bacterium]